MTKIDRDSVRLAQAILRTSGVALPLTQRQADMRARALQRIEALTEPLPPTLDVALQIISQVHAEAEAALGGPLAKEII